VSGQGRVPKGGRKGLALGQVIGKIRPKRWTLVSKIGKVGYSISGLALEKIGTYLRLLKKGFQIPLGTLNWGGLRKGVGKGTFGGTINLGVGQKGLVNILGIGSFFQKGIFHWAFKIPTINSYYLIFGKKAFTFKAFLQKEQNSCHIYFKKIERWPVKVGGW